VKLVSIFNDFLVMKKRKFEKVFCILKMKFWNESGKKKSQF